MTVPSGVSTRLSPPPTLERSHPGRAPSSTTNSIFAFVRQQKDLRELYSTAEPFEYQLGTSQTSRDIRALRKSRSSERAASRPWFSPDSGLAAVLRVLARLLKVVATTIIVAATTT
jgi:hypothetical protein